MAHQRNSAAISGYVGENGGGKTACLVHDAMTAMEEGRRQLSTVRLADWKVACANCESNPCKDTCERSSRPDHPLWVPFTSLEQLLDWRDGDVNMDEVQGIASAREHQGLPYQVANWLRKMRHYDVRLRWTAPDWMAPDSVIRRVTRGVTVCRGSVGKRHIEICPGCGDRHVKPTKRCELFGKSRLWMDNRMLTWKSYDARRFEEFNVNRAETKVKSQRLRVTARQMYWRPGGEVERAYDTYGEVLSLGIADQSGVCVVCGGSRRRKQCPGHGEEDQGVQVNGVTERDAAALGVFGDLPQQKAPSSRRRRTPKLEPVTETP